MHHLKSGGGYTWGPLELNQEVLAEGSGSPRPPEPEPVPPAALPWLAPVPGSALRFGFVPLLPPPLSMPAGVVDASEVAVGG